MRPWSYMGLANRIPKPTAPQRPWSYMGLADRIPKPTASPGREQAGDSPKGSVLQARGGTRSTPTKAELDEAIRQAGGQAGSERDKVHLFFFFAVVVVCFA